MTDGDAGGKAAGGQDPIVERKRSDPAAPVGAAVTLRGFLGNSDREGWRRVYFRSSLDHYAEVRSDDILSIGDITLVGEQASAVDVRLGAEVVYSRSRTVKASDPFDIDTRFGLPGPFRRLTLITSETCFDVGCVETAGIRNTEQTCSEFFCVPHPDR